MQSFAWITIQAWHLLNDHFFELTEAPLSSCMQVALHLSV
jgi:hypothetical protein